MTYASAATGSWTVTQFYCLLKLDNPAVLLLVEPGIELCECPISRRTARACHVFVTFICVEKLHVSRICDNSPQRVKWCGYSSSSAMRHLSGVEHTIIIVIIIARAHNY